MRRLIQAVFTLILFGLSVQVFSSSSALSEPVNLTQHTIGYLALFIFVIAYTFVILEEKTHLRKSKPVLAAAGIIWLIIATYYRDHGDSKLVESAIEHNFLEFSELFFFLLVAMTYINAMLNRGVFEALRNWLTQRGYSYRRLFWITGWLAFFISPIADNLTTALIMCAVILAVGRDQKQFIAIGCVNIVVAANAGGAFSPFGDITTLMVWQSGIIEFLTFLKLFVPSVINYLVPALIMQFFISKEATQPSLETTSALKTGGITIVGLFLLTIITAVSAHNFFHIPPVFGMMLGLAYLKIYGFYLHRFKLSQVDPAVTPGSNGKDEFDVFQRIAHAEWDTLLFFYGVILAVGGLAFIGYLNITSVFFYETLGPTTANVLVGILSAIVDNIPVMFAVLSMNPAMSESQWLLVTLTAGVGGSLLSIGSAAGVALMGQARGHYTFFSHLRWTPVIALGYAASIVAHILING